jgi:sec-independent protein translocase protein TatA
MLDVGPGELLVILIAALLLFGGRLPEVARNLGRSVASFKRGLSDAARPLTDVRSEVQREIEGDGGKRPGA